MRRCWIPLLLPALLCTGTSLANEQSSKELPWFEVEIIIFTRDLDQVSQSEKWPEYPGTPNFSDVRSLQPDTAPGIRLPDEDSAIVIDASVMPAPPGGLVDAQSTGTIPQIAEDGSIIQEEQIEDAVPEGPQPPVPYALIPEEEYRLTSAFRRLQKTGSRLLPVVHLAWRQPVTDREQSELLYVRALEKEPDTAPTTDITGIIEPQPPEPPKLEGTIRVSVNRYLHVDLDLLRYAKKEPVYANVYAFPEDNPVTETANFNTYRMQSHRRMRSGELHYLDHPLMGALIKITPYKLPEIIPEPIPETVVDSAVQPAAPTTDSAPSTETVAEPIKLAPQSAQPPAVNP